MARFSSLFSKVRALRRICELLTVVLILLTVSAPGVLGAQSEAERKQALQLFKDGQFNEALQLFEKVAKEFPDDAEVLEKYGFIVIGQASNLKDAAARKEARKRGRELLLRAEKAGSHTALLKTLLDAIPVDGGDDPRFSYSAHKEVEDAMKEGDAAVLKHDYLKAIEMYQRASLLDPNLYEAALYTGNVYFVTAEQRKAGEWFARAIAINPNRETAYRYWADSLMKQGRVSEAGDKFVEAYIAEPYNRLARAGFVNWAERINVEPAHPAVEIPTSVTPQHNGNATINLDPTTLKKDDKSGSGAAWMMYGLIRASWVSSEFAKQFPNEKTYRHSLKEEASAIRAALKVLAEQKNVDPQSMDPSLQNLARLDKQGLLESFILLALPDEGIAQDFAQYRKENVDKLRRYVVEYVLTGGVGKN